MGWIRRWGSLWLTFPSVSAPQFVSILLLYLVPLLRRTKGPTLWSSLFYRVLWSVNCILGILSFWDNIYLSVSPVFWGTNKLIPSVIAIPPAMQECSTFYTSSWASTASWVFFPPLAILNGVRWKLRVILICISLITLKIRHNTTWGSSYTTLEHKPRRCWSM